VGPLLTKTRVNCAIFERLYMGVGAGKFLGVQKIFARISPNSPEKILGHFLCKYFLMKAVFGVTSKKRSSCDLRHHFFPIKALWAQFFPYFQGVCPDFHQISCLLHHWFSVSVTSASYLEGQVSMNAARYDPILRLLLFKQLLLMSSED